MTTEIKGYTVTAQLGPAEDFYYSGLLITFKSIDQYYFSETKRNKLYTWYLIIYFTGYEYDIVTDHHILEEKRNIIRFALHTWRMKKSISYRHIP